MSRIQTFTAWASSPEEAIKFLENEEYALNSLCSSNYDMTEYGHVKVGEVEVIITNIIDVAEATVAAVDQLRKQKSKVYAEAESAVRKLDERIGRLLCIEDKGPASAKPSLTVECLLFGRPARKVIGDGDDDIPF